MKKSLENDRANINSSQRIYPVLLLSLLTRSRKFRELHVENNGLYFLNELVFILFETELTMHYMYRRIMLVFCSLFAILDVLANFKSHFNNVDLDLSI